MLSPGELHLYFSRLSEFVKPRSVVLKKAVQVQRSNWRLTGWQRSCELCLWLVERGGYKCAEHLGAAGSEQGRDIVAWCEGTLWAFQCKRVRSFGPRDALAEVEKVLALPEAERPVGLVLLVTCHFSAKARQQARERCAGEIECQFWAGTGLDERVKQCGPFAAPHASAG